MKDQIDKPLDRAVYWIEYVIRHEGAAHLRTSARHLTLFQRELFDISLVLIAVLCCLGYAFTRFARYSFCKLTGSVRKTVKVAGKCD
jgi:hypothetical protein